MLRALSRSFSAQCSTFLQDAHFRKTFLQHAQSYKRSAMALSRNASKKYLTGEEVKAFRISRGLTQSDMADLLGLTTQAVGMYEQRGVTKATALALSAI